MESKLRELGINDIEIIDKGIIKNINDQIIEKISKKGYRFFLITKEEGRVEQTFIDSGYSIIKYDSLKIDDFIKILSHGLGHLLGYITHCIDYIPNHKNKGIMCTPFLMVLIAQINFVQRLKEE